MVRVSPGTAIPSLPYLLTFPAARTPVPWSGSSSIYISRAGTPGAHAGAEPPSAGKERALTSLRTLLLPGEVGEPTRAATLQRVVVHGQKTLPCNCL